MKIKEVRIRTINLSNEYVREQQKEYIDLDDEYRERLFEDFQDYIVQGLEDYINYGTELPKGITIDEEWINEIKE